MSAEIPSGNGYRLSSNRANIGADDTNTED
jgi:hypothetical protein